MITTTLNALRQTRHLGGSISTHAYDSGELDALLDESTDTAQIEVCRTQTLSSELMAQILNGGFASLKANWGNDGKQSSING